MLKLLLSVKLHCASATPTNPQTLPELFQNAIWAEHFIKCIRAIKKREELLARPLQQELLELKLPPEVLKFGRFDEKVEHQMKAYFRRGEGVLLNKAVFTQDRLQSAMNQRQKLVFFPTHTTTGHMFQLLNNHRFLTVLVHGRYGVGKSMALVLYKLLTDHIAAFLCQNQS
jgi:hypothetical protein